jgi:phosphonopyruvate decarboxylase
MLDTNTFGKELSSYGYDFYTGVPCSFLKNLINYAINSCEYVAAANEGDAIATAAGAYVGGRKTVVLMQNSGLANAVSPLTSLNHPFQIPVLGFVSLRGEEGLNDEPQHELMGKITTDLLDLMNIKWAYLSNNSDQTKLQIENADKFLKRNIPFFFVVKKNTFSEEKLQKQEVIIRHNQYTGIKEGADLLPLRKRALEIINKAKDEETVLLATTGKTGRELYEINDTPHNLYMVGSLGCIASMGLGLSLVKADKNIIVIDGDGSLLMRMGSMATIGHYAPDNMLHILLDNNTHDSTGGQYTVSHNVDFLQVASSCSYTKSIYVHNLNELQDAITAWKSDNKQLTFLYLRIKGGSSKALGRPSSKPFEVKQKMMKFIADQ